VPTSTFDDPAFPERGDGPLEGQRASLAQGMDSAASTLREDAGRMPGGERVASAAHGAAGALETAADYVRDHDVREALSDVQRLVKRHPGATLLTVAALGFLLARAFTRHS
jgi:hypothetical protein